MIRNLWIHEMEHYTASLQNCVSAAVLFSMKQQQLPITEHVSREFKPQRYTRTIFLLPLSDYTHRWINTLDVLWFILTNVLLCAGQFICWLVSFSGALISQPASGRWYRTTNPHPVKMKCWCCCWETPTVEFSPTLQIQTWNLHSCDTYDLWEPAQPASSSQNCCVLQPGWNNQVEVQNNKINWFKDIFISVSAPSSVNHETVTVMLLNTEKNPGLDFLQFSSRSLI